jgi:tetratricopeptide (TPR) repeat protein
MNLCSVLAPDEIPRDLLYQAPQLLPGKLSEAADDRFVLDDAIEALRCYSLATVTPEYLSIHRLVQAVTQDKLTPEEKRSIAEAALRLVNEAFPAESDDVRTWPACKSLLSHALAITRHAEDLQLTSSMTGRLLNQVGLYLRGRAEFKEAMEVLSRAFAIDLATYYPEHPTIAIRLNNLGELFETLGRFPEAKERYERALAINRAYYGSNHETVASNLNNLGNVLKRIADSEVVLEESDIGIINAILTELDQIGGIGYGPMAPTVCLGHPSGIQPTDKRYTSVLNLKEARDCFKEALRINESKFGLSHYSVGNTLNNLGNVYLGLWNPTRAREHFERALTISQSFYGPDHPTVASICNSLGSAYRRLGNLPEAYLQYERALKIDQISYGDKHPLVALRLNNIAKVCEELGDDSRAFELYTESLKIFRNSLGPNHPYTITVEANLLSLHGRGRT